MKKLICCAVLLLAGISFAAPIDTITLAISDVTTNATQETVTGGHSAGWVEAIKIDVSASANMDIDVTDAMGQVIYSADDVTADVAFTPIRKAAIDTTGTAVASNYNAYARMPFVGPMTVSAGDEASTNKSVIVTLIISKE